MSVRGEPSPPVSAEFFRAVVDAMVDAVVTIDDRGLITAYNRAAERLFGYAAEHACGQPVSLLIPPSYRGEHDAQFGRHLKTGEATIMGSPQRVEGRRQDGSTFWCELTVTPFADGDRRAFLGVVRELGERERTLVARGEQRLRNIVDSLMTLLGVFSIDGVMLDVNQAALDAGGIQRTDVVGKPIEEIYWLAHSPAMGAQARAMIRDAAAGRAVREEFEIRTAGDGRAFLDVMMGPLRDASGTVTEVVASGIDTTPQRQAEREVRRRLGQQEAVARLGVLALKTRDLRTLLDEALRITHDVLGCELCEVIEVRPDGPLLLRAGLGWNAGLVGEARISRGPDSHAGRTLATNAPVVVRDLPSDGRFHGPSILHDHGVVSGLTVVVQGRDGPWGVLGAHDRHAHHFSEEDVHFLQSVANIVADVVRDQQTEEQLEQERIFSESLLESLPGIVFLVDQGGILVRWNRALERLTGYTEADLGHVLVLDLFAADERTLFRHTIKDVFESGAATVEGHLRSKDARLMPALFSALRIVVRGRPHLLGIGLDISDRRRLEEQLRHSQKMEALGQLAGGVAHDFNNLLTIITGFAGITLASMAPEDPARAHITAITDAAESAAGLTRQLLAFSRRTMMEPVVFNPNTVVTSMETMLRRLIGEDVQLSTALAPDLRQIRGDVGLVSQVLMNLAVNARDAMPKGGSLTIETSNVDLDAAFVRGHPGAHPGPHTLLAVTDTGTGMTAEVQARAFEPFFTTKGVGRGSGLGLAVVHGIVEQTGGRIELYSEPGIGTSFKIYFPSVVDAPPKKSSRPGGVPVAGALHGSGTILLVEDEDQVRRLARLILEKHGYKVFEARSGEDAIRVIDLYSGPLDLLVTDVVMPGIDGRDVARAVKAQFPKAKVLYLSGYTSDAVVRHGILHHEVAFLQKPFSATSLAAKVRDVLLGEA
jgi:PAS domain S-box-containing protein